MHKLIGICIETKDEKLVPFLADKVMQERLQEERYGFFDWYVRCDSVDARWTYPVPLPITSIAAQTVIRELFEHTKDEFHRTLVEIMKPLNEKSPNALFEDTHFKFLCGELNVNTSYWLFNNDGEQVDSTESFNRIAEGRCYEDGNKMYLVLYDAHS